MTGAGFGATVVAESVAVGWVTRGMTAAWWALIVACLVATVVGMGIVSRWEGPPDGVH